MVQNSLLAVGDVTGSNIITPSNSNQVQLFLVEGDGIYTLYSKTSTGDVNPLKAGADNVIITLTP